jgi:hypothetical protein
MRDKWPENNNLIFNLLQFNVNAYLWFLLV